MSYACFSLSLSLSILTAIFQVNLGYLCLLKQRMMEVVVTTGAISRAKLQSNHHHQQTNTQFFTGRMPFLSPNQQRQSTMLVCVVHLNLYKLTPVAYRPCIFDLLSCTPFSSHSSKTLALLTFRILLFDHGVWGYNTRHFKWVIQVLFTPWWPQWAAGTCWGISGIKLRGTAGTLKAAEITSLCHEQRTGTAVRVD